MMPFPFLSDHLHPLPPSMSRSKLSSADLSNFEKTVFSLDSIRLKTKELHINTVYINTRVLGKGLWDSNSETILQVCRIEQINKL